MFRKGRKPRSEGGRERARRSALDRAQCRARADRGKAGGWSTGAAADRDRLSSNQEVGSRREVTAQFLRQRSKFDDPIGHRLVYSELGLVIRREPFLCGL